MEIVDLINNTVNSSYQLDMSVVELYGKGADNIGGRGTTRVLLLKMKKLQRVIGVKRKWSENIGSSNSEASTSAGFSTGNSDCRMLSRLNILINQSSTDQEDVDGGAGEWGMEIESEVTTVTPIQFLKW